DPLELGPVRQLAGVLHGLTAILVTPATNRVEVFQRVADRVHLEVAVGATGALLAMLIELLTQSERAAFGILRIAVHGVVDVGGRRWRRRAKQGIQHPLAPVRGTRS